MELLVKANGVKNTVLINTNTDTECDCDETIEGTCMLLE